MQFADWRYVEPFRDPFCGSGTIAIEAAMIAKNMAPGKNRTFAFERFGWYNKDYLAGVREEAVGKEFPQRHNIIASDIDENAVEMARRNAERAGIGDAVEWRIADFRELKNSAANGSLVSNPPYGLRMNPRDLHELYAGIAQIFAQNSALSGGIITSYPPFFDMVGGKDDWKHRKLSNGGEPCIWYRKLRSKA